MFNICLFKQGKNLYNTLAKNNFAHMPTNKKRFTLLNEDEILAEEVKKFPCLYGKSSRSYRDRGVVRNAWVEVAKKLNFLEDGKCC